jgi:outer membrane protein TolC
LASFWTAAVNQSLTMVDVLDRPTPQPQSEAGAGAAEATPFLQRLEFRSLDAEKRGWMADARRARADLLPQASLVFQYGFDANRLGSRERGYAAFINLNVPVFDWFRAHSASQQFQLRASQVEASQQMAERAFSRDYQAARARVQALFRQIALCETQVKTSQENLRLSRVRFEGGEGLALDVVAAQSQLVQARSNYFSALAGYYNARADLEVAAAR